MYESGITKSMFETHKILKNSGYDDGVELLEAFMKEMGVDCSDLLNDYYNIRAKAESLHVDEIFFLDVYNPYIHKYLT